LAVGNLLVQTIVLMEVPIALGVAVKHWWPGAAVAMARVLGKIAFPALMLLAGIFFVQHKDTILDNFGQLGSCVLVLILLAIAVASLLSRVTRLTGKVRRTIVIEVGMQNAAQAIAVASSPFIFDNPVIATPAIIYALLMNVVLLTYVAAIRYRKAAA
jgi:BASS family bile acid:Na+ symporter